MVDAASWDKSECKCVTLYARVVLPPTIVFLDETYYREPYRHNVTSFYYRNYYTKPSQDIQRGVDLTPSVSLLGMTQDMREDLYTSVQRLQRENADLRSKNEQLLEGLETHVANCKSGRCPMGLRLKDRTEMEVSERACKRTRDESTCDGLSILLGASK